MIGNMNDNRIDIKSSSYKHEINKEGECRGKCCECCRENDNGGTPIGIHHMIGD
jgi:hypothetical protein